MFFWTPFINTTTFNTLENAKIPVKYADNSRYTFTHAKFWMIDDVWYMSTGNWAYSSFKNNRNYIYCSTDVWIYGNLKEIFLSDFSHEKPLFSSGMDSRMLLSPVNMRYWIEDRLKNAKKTIYIYNQSVTDPEVLDLLSKKKKQWLDVKVCHADNESDNTIKNIDFPYVSLRKPYLHAKIILLDDMDILIGSVNLTSNALDNNRELAFLIQKNNNLYRQLKNQFLVDCFP